MSAHARFSPSASSRWLECPASVRLTEELHARRPELAEDRAGEAAVLGTIVHGLAEAIYNQEPTHEFEEVFRETFPAHRFSWSHLVSIAEGFSRYCGTAFAGCATKGTEVRLTLPETDPLHDQLFGTADFYAIKGDTLHIVDLKTGRGQVFAEYNPQLMIYGGIALSRLAAEDREKIRFVELCIYQHTLGVNKPDIKSFTATAAEVDEFLAESVRPAIAEVDTAEPEKVSDACTFCPAKSVCPVQRSVFEDLDATKPADVMSITEMIEFLAKFKRVAALAKDIEGQLEKLSENPKYGLTRPVSRTTRRWASPELAAKALEERGFDVEYETKPVLPAPGRILQVTEDDSLKELMRESVSYGPWEINSDM